MIRVTLFDGSESMVNADLIETIERTPDTILSLVSGRKLLVRDRPEEIAERVYEFKRAVLAMPQGEAKVVAFPMLKVRS